MLRALALSIGQLGDPAILRVLARSMALTLAIFAGLGVGIWFAVRDMLDSGALAGVVAVLATLLALWLLFVVVAIGVVSLFADGIVAAVEARHYPQAFATARAVALPRAAAMGLGSAARMIGVNLIMLPIYAALLVTGVGTAVAFVVVNGWLLGRDLPDMVGARHLDGAAMRRWRKANRGRRFVLGLADAALFVVPVVAILAPVLGAAMATHLFHMRREQGARA